MPENGHKFELKDMDLYYGEFKVLEDVNLEYQEMLHHRHHRPFRLRQVVRLCAASTA